MKRLFLIAFLVISSCGGPRFDGTEYHHKSLWFRVGPAPSAWKRLERADTTLAYRDARQHATILVNGRCDIAGDDVPLAALTQHLFMRFTDRNETESTTLPLAGRETLRTTLSAKLDGVEKEFRVYVLKKDGCVYDFLLIADRGYLRNSVEAFDQFVMGFQTRSKE